MRKLILVSAVLLGLVATANADWRSQSRVSSTSRYNNSYWNGYEDGYSDGAYGGYSGSRYRGNAFSRPYVQVGAPGINYVYSANGQVDPYASGITVRAKFGIQPW